MNYHKYLIIMSFTKEFYQNIGQNIMNFRKERKLFN